MMEENNVEMNDARRRISPFTLVIGLSLVGLLALVGWGLANNSAERPQVGDEAPDVSLTFFPDYRWGTAETVMLSELEGEIVVLNFWASWCAECVHEADDLENTWQAYADQGVVFVGITYTDIESNSLQFLQEHEITYPNGPDLGAKIAGTYQLISVPETVIIDQNGRVAASTIGPVRADDLAAVLDSLLAQQDG